MHLISLSFIILSLNTRPLSSFLFFQSIKISNLILHLNDKKHGFETKMMFCFLCYKYPSINRLWRNCEHSCRSRSNHPSFRFTFMECLSIKNIINMNSTFGQLKPAVPVVTSLNVSNDVHFHHIHRILSFKLASGTECEQSRWWRWIPYTCNNKMILHQHSTRQTEEKQSGPCCPLLLLLLALYCSIGVGIIILKGITSARPSHIEGGGSLHGIFFCNKLSIPTSRLHFPP